MDDGLETVDPFLQHFWQLRRSGLLYAREDLWEDDLPQQPDRGKFLGFDGVAETAAEAIHCLVRLYADRLDDADEVVLRFRLQGLNGRYLGSLKGRDRPLRMAYVCHDAAITYSAQHALADWRAGIADHALDLCRHVYERFNAGDLPLDGARRLITTLLSGRR